MESQFASLVDFEAAVMKNAAARIRDVSRGVRKNGPASQTLMVICCFSGDRDQYSMRNTSRGHKGYNYLNHNPQLTSFVCLPIVDVQSQCPQADCLCLDKQMGLDSDE